MSIKGWCVCIFKKSFNTNIKFFANKHLPRSNKCKPSLYISKLEIFLHISTIFSLTFLITVYGSLLLKAIFYLLIEVPHPYSLDDIIPQNNHFFGNTNFRLTCNISIGFVTRYCVCSYKIIIFRRGIYNFCCTSLCAGLSQPIL